MDFNFAEEFEKMLKYIDQTERSADHYAWTSKVDFFDRLIFLFREAKEKRENAPKV